ncbi:ribonuclease III domain-containing protein [Amylocystis lapponica]|nr:ribonuclease III domain-containing protein [Amylocystis lapponica]
MVKAQLRGEIILEVFTHKSLRFPGAPINEDSDYGDNERLAILGQKVLETAITFTFFSKRPMISAEAITQRRDEMLSDANVESWIVGYKLREKVRCSPDAVASLTNSEEGRLLFSSFVGAVYVQNGMETVQDWIGKLVDPEYESPADEYSAYKRFKSENMGSPTPPPPPPMQQPPMPQPPPPMGPPPPLPVNNPLAPAQPSAAFLPLFNQTANQRRLAVEYPAQFSGPAHAGRWTVQCVVNGIEKGTGTGASKQLAKEEAARQAYYAMGWAPHYNGANTPG